MTLIVEPESEEQTAGSLWAPMDGYHCCWYPVALSTDVSPGQLKSIEFCDGQIVLYRGEDGVARVTTPFCPHMGANLSVGQVVGNDLQCAFHHWRFGPDGACTAIPSGDRVPKAAKIFSFPVEEKWGLIWVFFGREPLYPVPAFPDYDDERHVTRAVRIPVSETLRVDPWVFGTNFCDFQHFEVVHEIPNLNPDVTWGEFHVGWTIDMSHPTIANMRMQGWLWGVSSVVSRSVRGSEVLMHLAGMSPLGEQGLTPFMCFATEKGDDAEAILDQQQALHTELIQEDIPVMNSLRFGEAKFSASDRHLVKYLRYARGYPRARMSEFDK